MAREIATGKAGRGVTNSDLLKKVSYAVTTPAARGLPTRRGDPGYIGPETAFFGKYATTGGRRPGYTITTPRPARTYGGLIAGIGAAAERARQANIARRKRIEALYEERMKRYQPGGALERAGLARIERGRVRGIGEETQRMISGGVYGTTTAAQIPRRWEAEVGAPARLKLEDIMAAGLTEAQREKAGFLERIEEPYPDYSMLMQLLARG